MERDSKVRSPQLLLLLLRSLSSNKASLFSGGQQIGPISLTTASHLAFKAKFAHIETHSALLLVRSFAVIGIRLAAKLIYFLLKIPFSLPPSTVLISLLSSGRGSSDSSGSSFGSTRLDALSENLGLPARDEECALLLNARDSRILRTHCANLRTGRRTAAAAADGAAAASRA